MAHFKAFAYDTLINLMASVLLDLLHWIIDLASSAPACLVVFAPALCGLT